MLNLDTLKELLHSDLSRQDKLLLALAAGRSPTKRVKDVLDLCARAGLRNMTNWNISKTLARTRGLAIRVTDGWELSPQGWRRVREIAEGQAPGAPTNNSARTLRKHAAGIPNPETRAFVEEAVGCLEAGLLRAAIVFSWIGAVSLLYDHVVANHLTALNAEAARRDAKWKPALTKDDLARLREYDFLNVLEAISVLGKSVKHSLQRSLDLRNACGHPTSLRIGEQTVAAHLEQLTINVFAKFH